jgi:hypothetical protein
VAIGFHSLVDFNLAIPSNALTLAVLAGLFISARRATFPAPLPTPGPRSRKSRAAWSVACLLALLGVAAAAPAVAGIEGASRALEWLDGGNAARLFRQAREAAAPALSDLRVLSEMRGKQQIPSPESSAYVERRLAAAAGLQEAGLRHLPTSANGHLALGTLRAARCAAADPAGVDGTLCVEAGMEPFRTALRLNPMGARAHARVAKFLMVNWDNLDEPLRAEARQLVARAMEMDHRRQDVRQAWAALESRAEGAR